MSLTVMELAEEVRESNRRLAQAIDNLGQKFDNLSQKFDNLRVEIARDLGAINTKLEAFKVEIARDLGAINTNLEAFKGKTEAELGIARWAARMLTPAVIALIGFGFGGAWYLAKLDSRLDALAKPAAAMEAWRSQLPFTLAPAPDEPNTVPPTSAPNSKAVLPAAGTPSISPR